MRISIDVEWPDYEPVPTVKQLQEWIYHHTNTSARNPRYYQHAGECDFGKNCLVSGIKQVTTLKLYMLTEDDDCDSPWKLLMGPEANLDLLLQEWILSKIGPKPVLSKEVPTDSSEYRQHILELNCWVDSRRKLKRTEFLEYLLKEKGFKEINWEEYRIYGISCS